MLLVIFGAGASYDSVPSRPPGADPAWEVANFRMPLANDLFADKFHTLGNVGTIGECQPIIPSLQLGNVEAELEQLREEAEHYPKAFQQLAAVRFYLQHMLFECERRWIQSAIPHGISNYKTLLDQIEKCQQGGTSCLVTFNYDTLIDGALDSVATPIRTMDDYVSHDGYKLIKLHGSTNWGREIFNQFASVGTWDKVHNSIKDAASLRIGDRYVLTNEHPIVHANGISLIPAIAIPFESKKTFECPASHVASLERCLPDVSKVLTIGWRGAEVHFLEVLKKHLKRKVSVMIVAEAQARCQEVEDNLTKGGVDGTFNYSVGGFTGFVLSRELRQFLQRKDDESEE